MKTRPVVPPVALALLLFAGGARAESPLPPAAPQTGYSAQYRVTFDGQTGPGKYSSFADTVDIWVSGSRLRQESRIVDFPKIVIVDVARREVLEFEPEDETKTLQVFELGEMPVVYVTGSSVFEDFGAPVAQGEEKVAGKRCTVLHYGDPEDGALACVTADGIVARARIKKEDWERTWEALSLKTGAQKDARFAPPAGFVPREPAETIEQGPGAPESE